ncbi:homoserine O-succinyltransferase [Rhizobium sp. BK650]|uniref:homoserine O-acetyltransferase/O-succinyltransferase family protein n=1 Tax=Rhizobium sp. BK650 TaxID=2586990 RepID=UPI00160CB7E7|nr:homoserine O-succinyltransferase [Rhizobium sp. BK650]MBB3660996.1 homoserine O-succinyltransferase [Rhizobium sp. BK650]
MPVILHSHEMHPFLQTSGGSGTIELERAVQQDCRPLEIAVLNLMADKQGTERQLARWLGHTPLQINLTFAATDGYMQGVRSPSFNSTNDPSGHTRKFYKSWSEIKQDKFDGLLITGVNLLEPDVTCEALWPEIQEIFRWSASNVFSSLFLCWAAFAGLRYFHEIECFNQPAKILGIFEHNILSDEANLLFGFPDRFPVPIGRWQSLHGQNVAKRDGLEVVSSSEEGGPFLVSENVRYRGGKVYPRRVFMLNHPEYDTESIRHEYARDLLTWPNAHVPANYFPGDDVQKQPINVWRHAGNVYVNWVKTIYEATPFDLDRIPAPIQDSISF